MKRAEYVLTINGGSSTLKFALFTGEASQRVLSGKIDRIGLADTVLEVGGDSALPPERQPIEAADHARAAAALIDWLAPRVGTDAIVAVGHRVVHGGNRYSEPQPVSEEVVAELRRLSRIDPTHLPGEIAMIDAFSRLRSGLPQFACFDTAFHAAMPRVAQLLPLPRRFQEKGMRRYGFHGLSYQYLMEELTRAAGDEVAKGRVILAHLGNGASLAAVLGGRCVDTSMGFTPAAGIPMGTRSGDLDPGALVHLMRSEKWTPDDVDEVVNRRSGLLGVSDISSDMRDLLARRGSDERAAEAVALFCYQTRKWIGAFAAVLGGIDTLVFAAGIGESATDVRAEICAGLEFLGIRLDAARNAAGEAIISAGESRATVRVIHTDEELIIARTVRRLLARGANEGET